MIKSMMAMVCSDIGHSLPSPPCLMKLKNLHKAQSTALSDFSAQSHVMGY